MLECKDLKKMDILGKSDPFVRVFVMPGNHKELKTKVIKRNQNPLFNEVLKFVVSVYCYKYEALDYFVLRFLHPKLRRRRLCSKYLTGNKVALER